MLFVGCDKETKDCVESVNPDCVCTQQYDPVCGCNGITYGNGCMAACVGVSAVKGECNVKKEALVGEYAFLGYEKIDAVDMALASKGYKYDVTLKLSGKDDGFKVNGKASINFYSGSYEVVSSVEDKGGLRIEGFAVTKIGGKIEDLQFETDYWKRLSAATNYSLESNILKLRFDTEGISDNMIFKKK